MKRKWIALIALLVVSGLSVVICRFSWSNGPMQISEFEMDSIYGGCGPGWTIECVPDGTKACDGPWDDGCRLGPSPGYYCVSNNVCDVSSCRQDNWRCRDGGPLIWQQCANCAWACNGQVFTVKICDDEGDTVQCYCGKVYSDDEKCGGTKAYCGYVS
jgi:hypothetical protein